MRQSSNSPSTNRKSTSFSPASQRGSIALSKKSVLVSAAELDDDLIKTARSSTISGTKASVGVPKVYDFDTESVVPIEQHLTNIVRLLGVQGEVSKYCLQLDATKQYLGVNDSYEGSSKITKLEDAPQSCLLYIKIKPAIRAQKTIELIASALDSTDTLTLKTIGFGLRSFLKDSNFADEFLEKGGIKSILQLILKSSGNVLSYALAALREACSYVNGMEEVCSTPDILSQLFSMIDFDNTIVLICRTSLELLFVIGSYSDNGFDLLHNAALTVSKNRSEIPYQIVIKKLSDGDQDIKTNAITLLNVIWNICPDSSKQQEIKRYWEQSGIIEVLKNQTTNAAREFNIQLDILEENTGLHIRPKQEVLQSQIKLLKDQLSEYEAQQPLIQILKNELMLAQSAIKDASSEGTLISNSASLKRYVGEDTPLPVPLNFLKGEIEQKKKVALLEEKVKNNEKLIHDYERKISELEIFVSVNASLETKISKLKKKVKKLKEDIALLEEEKKKLLEKNSEDVRVIAVKEEEILLLKKEQNIQSEKLSHSIAELEDLNSKLVDIQNSTVSKELHDRIILDIKNLELELTTSKDEISNLNVLLQSKEQQLQDAISNVLTTRSNDVMTITEEPPKEDTSVNVTVVTSTLPPHEDIAHDKDDIITVNQPTSEIETTSTITHASIMTQTDNEVEIEQDNKNLSDITPPTINYTSTMTQTDHYTPILVDATTITTNDINVSPNVDSPSLNTVSTLDVPPPIVDDGPPPPPPPVIDGPTPIVDDGPPPPPPPGIDGPPPPPGFDGPPPPPGVDGPPPPPGMPLPPLRGMPMGGPKPTKPAIKPKVAMKPFHWNRILLGGPNAKRTKTIWDEIEEVTLDSDELESLFCKKQPKTTDDNNNATTDSPSTLRSTKKFVSVLDSKRSNAVAIMSAKLPAEDKLASAILNFDSSKLTKESIKSLITNLPTTDEILLIKSSEDPDMEFDKPERILLVLSSIPNLSERLKCWYFKLEFEEQKSNIMDPLNILKNSVTRLEHSDLIKSLLSVVLALGNYLNGGTNKGQADGFSVEDLNKLSGVKDANNKSILEYVVKIAKSQFPEKLNKFADDIKVLEESSRVSFDDLAKDFSSLQSNFNGLNSLVKQLPLDDPSLSTFLSVITPFFSAVEKELATIQEEITGVQSKLSSLMEYYGLPPNKSKELSSFISALKEFLQACSKILDVATKQSTRPIGKKLATTGASNDPISNLANAIKMGQLNNRALKKN